ncbi:MAG: hypothetical protein JST22_13600 [Bacteroidetes bacterium]|nr:hypothetical protein [Bacteroidota bacterium]
MRSNVLRIATLLSLVCTSLAGRAARCDAQWSEVPRIANENRTNSFVAYLNGTIYVFGGLTESTGPARTAFALNTSGATQWQPIASLPEIRFAGYAAALGGKVYLVGGSVFRGGTIISTGSVLEYDPVADTYTEKAVMPVPTAYGAGVVVGNRIFMLGGLKNGAAINTIQMYDVPTNTWSLLTTTLPQALLQPAATTLGAEIYLIGGSGVLASYNQAYRGVPSADGQRIDWTRIADYPDGIYEAGAGAYNDRVYVAAGTTSFKPYTDMVYSYDQGSNTWVPGYFLPKPVTNNSSCLVGSGNELYLIAGENGNGSIYRYREDTRSAIASVTPTRFVLTADLGQTRTATFTATNRGITTLFGTITIPPSDTDWLTTASLTFQVAPGGSQAVGLVASSIKAGGNRTAQCVLNTNDPNQQSIPITVSLYVRDQLPSQRRLMVIEEGTGDWCGTCPEGSRLLDSLTSELGDSAVLVSYHGGSHAEPMRVEEGQTLLNSLGLIGYPMGCVDRVTFPTEVVPMVRLESWRAYTRRELDSAPRGGVNLTLTSVGYANGQITATAEISTYDALPMYNGRTYALTALSVEDSVQGMQVEFVDTGTVIHPLWYHRNVVRSIYPDHLGQELGFRKVDITNEVVRPGSPATLTFSFAANVQNEAHGSIVVLVHERDGDTSGPILQAVRLPLPRASSAVSAPRGDADMERLTAVPNPVSTEMEIAFTLEHPAHARLSLYSMLGSEVMDLLNQPCTAGPHRVPVNLATLPAGIYTLVLHADGRTASHTITVMR